MGGYTLAHYTHVSGPLAMVLLVLLPEIMEKVWECLMLQLNM
jgi:hypothetical protein